MTRLSRKIGAAAAAVAMIGFAPSALADGDARPPEHMRMQRVACTCPSHQERTHERDGATAAARPIPASGALASSAAAAERDHAFLQQVWTAP